jgi:hypothetical protein
MHRLKLPNGFTFEDKHYDVVFLKEITGKQQNYLSNTKYRSPIDHILPVLSELIDSIKTEDGFDCPLENKLALNQYIAVEDIQFLFVKLRETSYDETMILEKQECTHCGKRQDIKVDLDKLEIIKPKKKQKTETELPKSKSKVQYRQLRYVDLQKHAAEPETLLDNAFTATTYMIVGKINDQDSTREIIEALPGKDIKHIQKNAPEYARIDTDIVHECSGCKQDFEIKLDPLAPDFLAL